MAETAKGKKFVRVHEYTRADGTKVPTCGLSDKKKSHARGAGALPSTILATPLKKRPRLARVL